jgi:peptidoglycan/xylan/chitin deacetylase (PgdA/CDA1 family)
MKYLHENGYRCVGLCAAVEALKCPPSKERLAVITFDDGYRDFYIDAFPILRKYAFGATMFIASSHTGDQRICLEGKEFMTWKEVREILAHEIEVGSHTVSHPQLCGLSEERVASEIGNSKQAIEDKLGCAVVSFSYPFAFPQHDRQFIRLIRGLLQMHGYKNGVCTTIGTASREHDVFFLPRLPANGYDDLKFYQAKLEGSYDWLCMVQTLYKQRVKPMILTPFEQLMETVF